jgi:hypothetical protein
LLAAIQATGASFGEAAALVAQAEGPDAVVKLLENRMRDPEDGGWLPFRQLVAALDLDAMGQRDPALARRLFAAWGERRKVDEPDLRVRPWAWPLPDGLRVGGSFCLSELALEVLPDGVFIGRNLLLDHCPNLVALPDNLVVKGELNLLGCDAFVVLPRGLRVKGSLLVSHCPRWDGRIPEDAVVGGEIYTNAHPYGVPSLGEWRERYPEGAEP